MADISLTAQFETLNNGSLLREIRAEGKLNIETLNNGVILRELITQGALSIESSISFNSLRILPLNTLLESDTTLNLASVIAVPLEPITGNIESAVRNKTGSLLYFENLKIDPTKDNIFLLYAENNLYH